MATMATDTKILDSPDKIASEGERIYLERYKLQMEDQSFGHFIAIDVVSEQAWNAEFPEAALEAARKAAPNGVFHLIRIGAPGAFKVSYGSATHDGFWGWPLRQVR